MARTRNKNKRGRAVASVALAAATLLVGLCWFQGDEILSWYYFRWVGFSRDPEEWPMWGGSPSRNLVQPRATDIPHRWDIGTGRNVKWVERIGTTSYSSPVVADGRIFLGTNNGNPRNPRITGDKGILMCLREEDGQFLWQAAHDKLAAGRVNDVPWQGVASTPVVENGRVYYVSNRCELVCVDARGFHDDENDGPFRAETHRERIDADFIWIYDMIAELGVFPHNLAASSPLVMGPLVFVVTGNGLEQDHITLRSPDAPSFIAVDKRTGRLAWKRSDPGTKILHGQWSSPAFGFVGGRPQVVFPGGDGWIYSFEPRTGRPIWRFDCNPGDAVWNPGRGTRNNLVATPVFVDGRVYIAVGQDPEHGLGPGNFYSIDASGTGDVTESRQIWRYGDREFRRSISTAAIDGDLIFMADLSGILHCVDRVTGRPCWVHDLMGDVWASPMVADGKVFIADEDGDVTVLEAGRTKKLLAETNMNNSVYSIPVASRGVLYINTRTHLFALANGADSGGTPSER